MLVQRDPGRAQARKDKTAMLRDARHLHQSQFLALESLAIGIHRWYAAQVAIKQVCPAVIHASKRTGVTLSPLTHGGAAMPAAVQQQVHFPLLVANHDHRLKSDSLEAKVPWVRDFAPMPNVDPSAMENLVHLFGEDGGIRVKADMHAVFFDQRFVIQAMSRKHARSPLCDRKQALECSPTRPLHPNCQATARSPPDQRRSITTRSFAIQIEEFLKSMKFASSSTASCPARLASGVPAAAADSARSIQASA